MTKCLLAWACHNKPMQAGIWQVQLEGCHRNVPSKRGVHLISIKWISCVFATFSHITYRSSSVPLLCVPFRRTSFASRSFSTAAPLTWNSLPPAVLNCDSLSTFKSRLKTHLFSTLSANYSTYLFRQRLCSRLTALWRYINFVLLLL